MTMTVCSYPGSLHILDLLWIVVVMLLRVGFVMEIDNKVNEMSVRERSTGVMKESESSGLSLLFPNAEHNNYFDKIIGKFYLQCIIVEPEVLQYDVQDSVDE
jgi:predicted DNA-binding transcriptional regulator YafY